MMRACWFAPLSLGVLALACSGEPFDGAAGPGGQSGAAGSAQPSAGKAGSSPQAGAAGSGGSSQAGQAGSAQAGSGAGPGGSAQAGSSQAGQGGSAQAGSGGSSQAGSGGSPEAGSGGSPQAGSGGSAQAGSGGSPQAGSAGSAQAGQGGSSQAGSGGSAQAGQGGSAQAGSGGSAGSGAGSGGGGQSGSGGQGGSAGQGGSGGGSVGVTEDPYGCAAAVAPAGTRLLRVDAAAAPGGDGSLASPFRTMQQAYSAVASGERGVVCVAEGEYVEFVGSGADLFTSKREFVFVGGFAHGTGFAVRDTAQHATVLRAPDRGAAALTFGNVRSFTVDGLRITGGLHGVSVTSGYSAGRTAVVRHCHIVDNGVDGEHFHEGAGLDLSGGSVLVERNLIEGNHGGRIGAGIYIGGAPSAECNKMVGGNLQPGSAMAIVRDNVVRANTLRHDTPHGVGIAVSMNALIERNVVVDNEGFAQGGGEAVGGGVFVQNPLVTAVVRRNWIQGNRALKGGSAVFADEASIVTVVNNVIVGNVAVFPLGAVLVDGRAGGDGANDRGYLTLLYNTIAHNTGGGLAAQDSEAVAVGNLFWDNGPADLGFSAGGDQPQRIVAHHNRLLAPAPSGLPGTLELGPGNVDLVPGFVDDAGLDLHLGPTSALLGLGPATFTPAFVYPGAIDQAPADDFDGAPRLSSPDLGAFERSP